MATISRGAFDSSLGKIAAKDTSLKLPGEGEVFFVTGNLGAFGSDQFSNQLGYMENGQLKVFDVREQIVNLNQQVQQGAQDFNLLKNGSITQDFRNSFNDAGGTLNIGGQTIKTSKHQADNGNWVFVAEFPDGKRIKTVQSSGNPSLRNLDFANKITQQGLGIDPGLRLGHNSGGASASGSLNSNIKQFIQASGNETLKTGQGLNTYSLQELEQFAGKAQSVNDLNVVNQQLQTYQASPGFQAGGSFIRSEETQVGEGATDFQALKQEQGITGQVIPTNANPTGIPGQGIVQPEVTPPTPAPIAQDSFLGREGQVINPSTLTRLQPGSQDFENFLTEQGITRQGATAPTQPAPATSQYLANETELQSARQELGALGIPTNEWNKYISSPDASGKIFYTKPAQPTTGAPPAPATVSSPPAGSTDVNINPQTLTNEGDLGLPGVTQTDSGAGFVAAGEQTSKDINQRIEDLTPDPTALDNEQSDLETKMTDLLGDFAQKGPDQLAEEEARGLPRMRTDLKTLQGEIDTRTAQYKELQSDIEGRPITMSSIIGSQAQVEKKMLAEIGTLQAQASAMAGNINEAQTQANRAIDLKYSVFDATFNIYQAQLDMLDGKLDKQDEIRRLAQNEMLNEARQATAERKAVEKNVANMALTTITNGGDKALSDAIANAGSELEAATIGGRILTEPGWQYEPSPAERDRKLALGWEKFETIGRTYVRPPEESSAVVNAYVQQVNSGAIKLSNVPADVRNDVAALISSSPAPSGGGGSTVTTFKFSSNDRGRLLGTGLTGEQVSFIQEDLNQYGIDKVLADPDLTDAQKKGIQDVANRVTPTQASATDKITEGKRKVIGGVNALMTDNATNDEIEEYIKLKGYTKEDFADIIDDYQPTVEATKWWQFWK